MTEPQPTYWRVPFELSGDVAPLQLPDPPSFTWHAVHDDSELIGLLARALEASIDPRDAAAVRRDGSLAAAEEMIDDAASGRVHRAQREWWQIIAVDDVPAGVVLPVVFARCDRDGLDEGTIYHLAVVPEQRARGIGHLLLGRATDVLLAHGVWQISCDTAVENIPMIRLFERQNWTRRPAVESPAG